MDRSATTPDEFLASLPDGVRQELATLDAELSRAFEGHERTLWEGPMWGGAHQRIIGYGSLVQQQSSGAEVEWFVVGLAAQKGHLSLYVSAVEDGQYLVKRWADRLGKVKVGSANVTFRRVADLDLPAVIAMVARARDLTTSGWRVARTHRQSGNASGPRSDSSRACSPESSGGIHEYG